MSDKVLGKGTSYLVNQQRGHWREYCGGYGYAILNPTTGTIHQPCDRAVFSTPEEALEHISGDDIVVKLEVWRPVVPVLDFIAAASGVHNEDADLCTKRLDKYS